MAGGAAVNYKRLDAINSDQLIRDEDTHISSFCFIANDNKTRKILTQEFGRTGLCLKVFKKRLAPGQSIEDFIWNKTSLIEATKVQNLFASHGLAPRVYAIVLLEGDQVAQVTDFVSGQQNGEYADRIEKLMKRYDIRTRKWNDFGSRNWVGGKFVDFGEFYFAQPEAYEKSLVEQAYTRRGENIGTAYQPVPEIGVKGTRDLSHRLRVLRLDEVDFQGKTVLNLGCNLGAFCRLACDRGAKRVVGIDRTVAGLAYEISNWLGYWNIDFLAMSLPPKKPDGIATLSRIKKFDIVFSMAIHNYMNGDVDWMANICRETFIFEGHGGDPKEVYQDFLARHFERVDYLGETTDNYIRQVYRARRGK